jgi:hypothetical protein
MKILLLDTNVSSYPIYEYLLSKSFDVYVAGLNNEDCLAKCCKNFLKFDYSSLEEVENAVDKYQIENVLPGCNDVSYRIACLFANKHGKVLNLDNPHINSIINEKDKFKDFAMRVGLKVPRKISLDKLESSEINKVIIKPVDAFSGKGISVLSREDFGTINLAIQRAKVNSLNNNYIIEEFVDGQLYSHSAFLENGKIIIDFIVEEYCLAYPFAVDTSWVNPSEEFTHIWAIREQILLLAHELNLKDGLIHTQFIQMNDDIKILEVTRRCPGDLYSKLIEYSTGIFYAQNYINCILGLPTNFKINHNPRTILRHTLTFKNQKIFISLRINLNERFLEFVPIEKTGTILDLAPKGRAGLLFIELTNQLDLYKVLNQIKAGNLTY